MTYGQEGTVTAFLFHEGTEHHAYRYLGCHRMDGGYVFRVWAPCAAKVYVVGDFNGWSEDDPMESLEGTGFWEAFIPSSRIREGGLYKYKLFCGQNVLYKADPFAASNGGWYESASRIFDPAGYPWRDGAWMEERKKKFSDGGARYSPVNIYELHMASWNRGEGGRVLSYTELGNELCPYLLQMGFTHVELTDALWDSEDGGISSFYSPSGRFGSARDFMELVEMLHRAGIGVAIEMDMFSFLDREEGLASFDGTSLYELGGEAEDTRFDLSKREVRSFLISNALYFADLLHIDVIRLKSIGRLVYNERGAFDRQRLTFIRSMNSVIREHYPDVITITDDDLAGSSAVTSTATDGLGFTFKWDSVCTRDTLDYASIPLRERDRTISVLSAPLKHAFGEASVLTLSLSDVAEGKKSFLSKMPGVYEQKFAGNRVFFTYMMTRPGKKFRFMGSEIGQFDEWDPERSVQWFLLDYESHARLQLYLARLNHIYLETPALWEQDCTPAGFVLDMAAGGVLAYRRRDKEGTEIVVVLNFTPYRMSSYTLGVGKCGEYEEILSSDSAQFGGSGIENGVKTSSPAKTGKTPYCVTVDLPPLGALILKNKDC
ncbi:MAG: alpha amylase C-terminal domain-containing protein [Clostridia bacterium]|nr:alpha amylase C-terminal domain-containing protein [Clostridia bacterium]